MEKLIALTRYVHNKDTLLAFTTRLMVPRVHLSSSDDEKKIKKTSDAEKKSEDALNKLNDLLKRMIAEDVSETKAKLKLAKPNNRRKKHIPGEEKQEKSDTGGAEKQIINAVKNVAQSMGGDIKQTESELLSKLLDTDNGDKAAASLTDIVKGMKIDREIPSPDQHSRAEQVRQILQKTRTSNAKINVRKSEQVLEKINLFGSEPLGIFTDIRSDASEGIENRIWTKLYQRDLKLAVTHPPSNYFQQMILWTEQGKIWKFPIDNEQGLTEEKNVYFAEHVFLDKHLEPWCPPKGPIRHFMELVCVGLSKNPYLTVNAKKEHIEWFRNYFQEKKQLLKEVGLALNDSSSKNVKQLE